MRHNNHRDTSGIFNSEMIGVCRNGLLSYAIILTLPPDNTNSMGLNRRQTTSVACSRLCEQSWANPFKQE